MPSTSCLHLRKPRLALFLPKISFSNLLQWLPFREYFNFLHNLVIVIITSTCQSVPGSVDAVLQRKVIIDSLVSEI